MTLPKISTIQKKICPVVSGQNFSNNLAHILGNAASLYIPSDIS
jgi:hypothetical protein